MCTRVCACGGSHVRACVCISLCMCVRARVHVCALAWVWLHMCLRKHVRARVGAHACALAGSRICGCACMRACLRTCAYICLMIIVLYNYTSWIPGFARDPLSRSLSPSLSRPSLPSLLIVPAFYPPSLGLPGIAQDNCIPEILFKP